MKYYPLFIFTIVIATIMIVSGCKVKSSLPTDAYAIPIRNVTNTIFRENSSLYRISSSDAAFTLPDTPFQKIIKKNTSGNNTILIIRSGENNIRTMPNKNKFIQDTRFLNIGTREIRKLANITGHGSNAISEIEHFVYRFIEKKIFGIPIIPARNIVSGKSGDCTEHAILAIALLRSKKIPARAVVGMFLTREFAGKKNVFVFHMWAEAFSKGRWVLVDATRPGEKNPNRYITFTWHHLKTAMPLTYLKSIAAIKNLEVTYLRSF